MNPTGAFRGPHEAVEMALDGGGGTDPLPSNTKVDSSPDVRVVEPYKGHSMASGLEMRDGSMMPP